MTREVNADRRGPKDLMDLATKAQALKGFIDARMKKESAERSGVEDLSGHQKNLDDAFENLMDVHGNDQSAVAATAQYVHSTLMKGKSN